MLMNSTLRDTLVAGLRDRYCCFVPELPFVVPMPDDTDLSLAAPAIILAEFLTELDLHQVAGV